MKQALALTFGSSEKFAEGLLNASAPGSIVLHDLYELPALSLERFGSLLISMHCDQRFLAECAAQIASFLDNGGTVVANGHFAYPFLPGMTGYHTIEGARLHDFAIVRVTDHPIWQGVSAHDLTYRRGVAGFYARVWHDAPAGAQVINGLGHAGRPVDLLYSVGRGRVLHHGGNDLWQFSGNDSTGRISRQLVDWLQLDRAVQ